MKKSLFYLMSILCTGILVQGVSASFEEEEKSYKGKVVDSSQKTIPSTTAEKTGSRKSSEISNQTESEEHYRKILSNLPHNKTKAISEMQGLADKNDINALIFMGNYYSNGVFVKFNESEALDNFEKALSMATNDFLKGSIENEIGSIYYAVANFEEAKKHYEQACSFGSAAAEKNLKELME